MISIIIPVLNQHELSNECIAAVYGNAVELEVVVVDNGSNPRFEPTLCSTLIRNEENTGFPKAINQGIEASTGDIICLLNNDVILPRTSLKRLVAGLSQVDIVGPVSNYVAGVQKVTLREYNDLDSLDSVAEGIRTENAIPPVLPVNFIIGFCMLFHRHTFNAVGPFDDSLWPCSGEEIDWCLRARSMNFTIGVALDTYVHHFGSRTFGDLQRQGQLDYQQICNRNDKHIAERWGEGFWQRQVVQSA